MACIAVILGPIAPAAQALPGGKANYVVSFGLLRQGTSGDDWVRLGTYQLGTDGRVRSRTWWWDQRQPAARVGTGTVPAGTRSGTDDTVRRCEIQTVAGFTSAAPELRSGRYHLYTADDERQIVNIDWDLDAWLSEEWSVHLAPGGTYSRLSFKYAKKFTHGYGYGSNAAFTERRAMSTVLQAQSGATMTFYRAAHDEVKFVKKTWGLDPWRLCTVSASCLTVKIQTLTSCNCTGSDNKALNNYIQKISSSDRRDTFWHWCDCFSEKAPCPRGNSHVHPLLQIIDGNGGWRGWVGVEAAFYPSNDMADPRSHDMLSVLRVADWI
ncbi:hypothetical protein HD597_005375 [Nonomuraea thailandensis]|uniref:Uncharacterized protein n=1 Tax=Nonomuraea thailandensis TaxID=1188745 RepID=A0A9X2GIJ5_9ACTN|nr:hypothetical protein [Nonomuraea thailandensis]MCP2358355.1 hypothetical protein [Nonomuraea thailandensis]